MSQALTTHEAMGVEGIGYGSEFGLTQGMSLRDIEKTVILATLRRQLYNRTHTARVLGIGIRTLQRKLKEYREIDHGGVFHIANYT